MTERRRFNWRAGFFAVAFVLLMSPGLDGARAVDMHRLVGLESSAEEDGQTGHAGWPPASTDGVLADSSAMEVEPIPEEHDPTTWLIRTASGEVRMVCGRSLDPARAALRHAGRPAKMLR